MGAPRVLVVYKKSTYERYASRSKVRLQGLLDANDISVEGLEYEHQSHQHTMEVAKRTLKELGAKAEFRHRPKSGGDGWDLIVTLGGDGTLLWASHLADASTPMVAINSAPDASVGYFAAGDATNVAETLSRAMHSELKATKLSRVRVDVDGQTVSNRVLNDVLFCHECPAATARYVIEIGDARETQMSSGIWVGPAAGSTAAIRSAGGKVLPIGSRKIQYVVREPYHGRGPAYTITKGVVSPGEHIVVHCKMPQGHLYMDGAQKKRAVPLGAVVQMLLSDQPLVVLGLSRQRLS